MRHFPDQPPGCADRQPRIGIESQYIADAAWNLRCDVPQMDERCVVRAGHRSAEGKLAVIAVLMDPGPANLLIQKVWTHMPLDVQDKVRLPGDLVNLNDLLPVDRRYYQFMGSLTTPPCTEGVLWMVLKQPVTLSREQLRVFAQLFPNNARPIQPLQGRIVRNAE